ncbi:hypothetical protein [Capsulimonas corticalis]|nr:hypothetical protein [Capsulimonas corticalis]
MNINNSSITGLILREGRIRSITISAWPLLIFDAKSLARAWADKMAAEATAAGLTGDSNTAVTLARAGAELVTWLRDPAAPTPSWPEIAVRQQLRPLVVGREELSRYMDAMWEWSKSTEVGQGDPFGKVDFLLDVDATTISATRKNRVILRHAGDIRAHEVSRLELENQIATAMIMCAPELKGDWDDVGDFDPDEQHSELSGAFDSFSACPSSAANTIANTFEANTVAKLGRALSEALPQMNVSTETQIGDPHDNIYADLTIPEARLMIEVKNWSGNDAARLAGDAILALRPADWRGMLIDGREIEEHLGDVVERIVGLCVG